MVGWQDVISVRNGTMKSVYLFQRIFHLLSGIAQSAIARIKAECILCSVHSCRKIQN